VIVFGRPSINLKDTAYKDDTTSPKGLIKSPCPMTIDRRRPKRSPALGGMTWLSVVPVDRLIDTLKPGEVLKVTGNTSVYLSGLHLSADELLLLASDRFGQERCPLPLHGLRHLGRDRPAGKPEWMTVKMTIFFCLILKHPLSYSFFGWVLPMYSVKASQL